MRRKVIKQGNGTLTITLPKEWTKKVGLKGGQDIEVVENHDQIVISKKFKRELGRIELDISDFDYASIGKMLRSVYKLGYEEIYLHFNNTLTKEQKTNKLKPVSMKINHEVNTLLGCEIIEQTKNSCLIKDYSNASTDEFDTILKKVFIMMLNYNNEFIEQTKTIDKEMLATMRGKHFNISKFLFYSLRILNKVGYKDNAKLPILYHTVASFDNILDIVKYAAANLLEFKQKQLRKETLNIITRILSEFRRYYDYFYKPTHDKVVSFGVNRWEIIRSVNKIYKTNMPRNELLLISDLRYIHELLYDLFEAKMSLIC